MPHTVTLGGRLLLADQVVRWPYRTGVEAARASYEMHAADAAALLAGTADGSPVQLAVDGSNVGPLWVTGVEPTTHPQRAAVGVVDVRWLWSYVWLGPLRYNVTRKTAHRRWLAGALQDVSLIADDLDFAVWSIDGATRFDAAGVVRDVFKRLAERLEEVHGVRLNVGEPPAVSRQLPVRDIEIDDPGHVGVGRALALAPGLDLYVEGLDVHFVARHDRSEAAVVEGAAPYVVGAPYPRRVDRARLRPREIHVYLTPEYELRLDHREDTGTQTGSQLRQQDGEDPRELDNVVRVPLRTLVVEGRTMAAGTWITVDQLLAAITGKARVFATGTGPITHSVIQDLWIEGLLGMAYAKPAGLTADPDWTAIVGSIYASYRQDFRIKRHWLDRMVSWRPERLAILDEETGRLGRSNVFADYAVRPGMAVFGRNATDDTSLVWNKSGWAENLADATPAQAHLTVVDEDLGVMRVAYQADQWQNVAQIFPSQVVASTIPTRDIAGPRPDVYGITLAASHRLAVVISAVPALPRGVAGLHRVVVTPTQAGEKLGVDLGACTGPVLELHTDATTARFGWLDALASSIEGAFGVGGRKVVPGELESLLLDRAEVEDVAQAVAASHYADHLDQVEGAAVVGWQGGLRPTGNLTDVEYQLHPTGRALVALGLPPRRPRVPWRSLIRESTGRRLFRRVQRGR